MRIEQKVTIDAPRQLVWEYVTEPANYLVFMEGLTRWDIAGDRHTGLGARYRVLFRVGAADVGGLIEIVEWQPESDMAWSSVTGVDQIAERVAAGPLNQRFRDSLQNVKRAVESQTTATV